MQMLYRDTAIGYMLLCLLYCVAILRIAVNEFSCNVHCVLMIIQMILKALMVHISVGLGDLSGPQCWTDLVHSVPSPGD